MNELIQAAIAPSNILFTILLVFILLYWLTVFIGLLDVGSFDVELDVEAELDAEVDTEIDSGGSTSWLASSLHFFNFGQLPFMIILSVLVLSMWSISIMLSTYVSGGSLLLAALFFFPNLAISLLITKVVTTPLIPIFKNFNGSVAAVDYIGHECLLILPPDHQRMGQAEVLIDNSPLLVNVKVADQQSAALRRGQKALIVDEAPDGKYFLIQKIIPT